MNKAFFIFSFCLSVLLHCSFATAENSHAFYPLPHQERGSFVAAKKIIANTNGGLWFVDAQGALIFYDGERLDRAVDQTGEPITGVTDAVMQGQTLWLVKDGYAYRFLPTTAELKRLEWQSAPLRYVISHQAGIWFAGSEGLYAITDEHRQPEFVSVPESVSVTGLYSLGDSIFVAGKLGIYEFRDRQLLTPRLYPRHRVTAVFEDSTEQLWFGTQSGLFLSRQARPVLSSQDSSRHQLSVSAIAETKSGIWVGTAQGLKLIDKASLAVSHYRADAEDEYTINNNRVIALIGDEKYGLWIATESGINYLPASTSALKRFAYGSGGNNAVKIGRTNQLHQIEDGSIWLATDKGLTELDDRLEIVRQLPLSGGVDSFAYKKGTFWLATRTGLKAYSLVDNEWLALNLPSWFEGQAITSLMVDHYNSVWIGMESHLYRYWPKTSELNSFGSHWFQAPYGSEAVTVLFEDSHHHIWVGTDYALYQFDTGLLSMVEQTASLGGVIDIYEDILGQLWVINNHSLQYSPKQDKLPLEPIVLNGAYAKPYCIDGDNSGSWVTTSQGLSYYSLSAQLRLHLPPLVGGVEKESYSQACEILQSGKLLLGGKKGLLEIEPKKLLASEKQQFSIIVGNIRVDNQLARLAGGTETLLTVSYGSSVSFDIGVLPFSGFTKLQYRLIGEREAPWESFSHSSLFFDNLNPGDYQLELRFDGENPQDQPEIRYSFQVSGPWYLSYWSTSLLVALLILLLLLLIGWRARAYHRQNLALKQAVFGSTARIELHKKQLYASNKHLQRILHMRQNFMAQLYSELRSPLSLILGPIRKMQATSHGEENEQLHLVANNIERSLHLVEQLLTRDAQAFIEPEKRCEQWISPIIQACCLSWQLEAEQRGIALCLEDETDGVSVKVAPYHLEIMLGNLLSNALKYTPRSGCINVSVKSIDHRLVVSVSDTGKGMSEEVRDNIFDSYFKEDTDFNPEAGFGLGLSTVKQLVELYEGEVSVVSYPGVGSEFVITLPLYREGCMRTLAGEDNREESAAPKDDLPKLLVASTDEEVVACLTALLEEYPLLVASDGYEAVFLAKENQPDMILCDLDLPGLGGLQVRERLQEDPRECQPAFILMVDNSPQEHIAAGVDLVLTKPFEPGAVLNHIQFLLSGECPPYQALISSQAGLPAQVVETSWRQSVMSLVEEQFDQANFGTAIAANALYMSERSLQRKFKQEFGMSFKDYVSQFRFEQAKRKLKQGERVSDVALSCGFNDPSYFSARFKGNFGITPSQYAAQYQH